MTNHQHHIDDPANPVLTAEQATQILTTQQDAPQ